MKWHIFEWNIVIIFDKNDLPIYTHNTGSRWSLNCNPYTELDIHILKFEIGKQDYYESPELYDWLACFLTLNRQYFNDYHEEK